MSATQLLLSCIICHSAYGYTYWRYGDGSFTNSLPQNHSLFSTGVLSDYPVHKYKSSFNQTYFYPLISDTNEIFALTHDYTQLSQEKYCMAPLSLIKLNQYLNETLANISIINSPLYQETCFQYEYSYPIYHKQENGNEYIIINIAIGTTLNGEFKNHLWIINASDTMSIISNTTSKTFYYDWHFANYNWYNPLSLIIHNGYIIQQITGDYGHSGNLEYFTNFTAYNLKGEELWNMYSLDFAQYYVPTDQPYTTMQPIAINNTMIVSQPNPNDKMYKLVAINITKGDILYNITLPISFDPQTTEIIQPVTYQNYIIGGYNYRNDSIGVFHAYVIRVDNGEIIGVEHMAAWPWHYYKDLPQVSLAINAAQNRLIISNFTYIDDISCNNVEFAAYSIDKNEGDGAKVVFNLIKKAAECVVHSVFMPQLYFVDENGECMIGYYYSSNNWPHTGAPFQSSYSMVAPNMQLLDRGNGFNITNQRYQHYPPLLQPYPAIGSNGLIYFAGIHSIDAYDMNTAYPTWSPTISPTVSPTVSPTGAPSVKGSGGGKKDDSDAWMYIVIGASGLILMAVILYVVASHWDQCPCCKKEEPERLIN